MRHPFFACFIFLCVLCANVRGDAQILPPDFLCVRGDTLVWQPANNPCGPFQAYEIYVSDAVEGPYSLLVDVTDPATSTFFHANPGDQQRFYYLRTSADCPGLEQLSSDTLDNRDPEISPIQRVSVEGADIRIDWAASPSPETIGYIVYRRSPVGFLPLDTVFVGTTYLDTDVDPTENTETYLVNALDACGNTSLFDLAHTSLRTTVDRPDCSPGSNLRWNAYENWPGGVDRYVIYVGVNGGAPVPVDSVAGDLTSYSYPLGNDGETLEFFVRAYESGTANFANSSRSSLTLAIVQPQRPFAVGAVAVLSDGSTQVNWTWDPAAELTGYELYRVRDGETELLESIATMGGGFMGVQQYDDPLAGANDGPVGYFVVTTDECGNQVTSLTGYSTYLEVTPQDELTNQLVWTAPVDSNYTVTEHTVFRAADGNFEVVATLPAATFSYLDVLDQVSTSSRGICYLVRPRIEVTAPGPGGLSTAFSVGSNDACIFPDVRVFLPNAFTPDGQNPEFRPVFSSTEGLVYELRIFDRYGRQVFQTDDPLAGWRGRVDGRTLPGAVYTYRLVATQLDGRRIERTGSVLLLR